MSRLTSILRPDAFLFIALAAVFWLVMTVSNADTARVVNVTVISEERIVDDLWLLDTAATVQVRVSAQGINILGLRKLNNTVLSVPSDFWNTSKGSARVKGSDLLPSISDAFGNSSIQVIDEFVTFPSTPIRSAIKAVEVRGLDKLTLPKGFNWLESPHIDPLVIEIKGSSSLVESVSPFIEVTEKKWEGAMGLQYPIQGMPHGVKTSLDEVVLLGHSAAWSDKKIKLEHREGTRVYTIKVWVSGPADELKSKTAQELGELSFDRSRQSVFIDFVPFSKNVVVLQVQPSNYPIFDF